MVSSKEAWLGFPPLVKLFLFCTVDLPMEDDGYHALTVPLHALEDVHIPGVYIGVWKTEILQSDHLNS